jgi:hypothetical protein
LIGPSIFQILLDRGPDRGLGLFRSINIPVFSGSGPVQSRSFSSPETGLPSTIHRPHSIKARLALTALATAAAIHLPHNIDVRAIPRWFYPARLALTALATAAAGTV